MPFNRKPQKFNAQIKAVEIGVGEKAIKIGGENILPFYTFDGDMGNTPKVGVEISDMGLEGAVAGIVSYYEGCTTAAEMAKKAAEMEGADFVALSLEGGDPNGANKSTEELVAVAKEVADAIVRNGAVYFAAVGRAGALLSKSITSSEVIAYDDLGTEAIRRLTVNNFPVIVVIDAQGNNLYETATKKYCRE